MGRHAARILYVGEDPSLGDRLRDCLDPTGYEVLHAVRLWEAVELLAEEPFRVAMLDLALPGGEAIEGLRRIHDAYADLPVIMLLDREEDPAWEEARRLGAQDFLKKSGITSDLCSQAIRHAVERHRLSADLERARHRLEEVALVDPLTTLLNRRGLDRVLSGQVGWWGTEGTRTTVALVNLDGLRGINDRWGHSVGDLVLQTTSDRIREAVRKEDFITRVGGDEFLVLMPGIGVGDARPLAEKIRVAITRDPVMTSGGEEIRVTATVGIAEAGEGHGGVDEIIIRTQQLLKEERKGGGNRVVIEGKDPIHPAFRDETTISRVLRTLQSGERLTVVRHPILRIEDEKEVACELLSRAAIPVFDKPGVFLRVAMEHDVLTPIDLQCYKTCLAVVSHIPRGVVRHVNLFPSTILAIPEMTLLESIPIDRQEGEYCIEISEQQILGDPGRLAGRLGRLRKEGIRIALDDVGFGRSSLEALIDLEPEVVKIDRRCVAGVATREEKLRPLRLMLRMLDGIGAMVIAEGVERKDDLEVLRELGVEYAQGFLWGEPEPIGDDPPAGAAGAP